MALATGVMGRAVTDRGDAPRVTPRVTSSLRLRVLSALVLIPAALAVFYLGGWLLIALVVAVGAIMFHEWLTICERRAALPLFLVVVAALIAVGVLIGLKSVPGAALAGAIGVVCAGLVALALGRSVVWGGLGAFYVLVPIFSVLWLREVPAEGFDLSLWLLTIVWATDIGAYLVGSKVGGPRLAPRISPKKTWSGLGGGMIGAALASLGIGVLFDFAMATWLLLGVGAVLAVAGQMGDLMESALKRRFGVKDSGSIIPGHGGVLDRVDGLVVVAPLVALGAAFLLR